MPVQDQLQQTLTQLVQPGKGILAADESAPTIAERFKSAGGESTKELRRSYRSLLLATPGLGEFISGVILCEETLGQRDDAGTPLPDLAARQGIVPGIKVDKGKLPLAHAADEEITEKLDGLEERLQTYQALGARFAKWRDVFHITASTPSRSAIEANAEVLARYAAICQSLGVVPIVEQEVLIDGDHNIDRAADVSEAVLREVFFALRRHRVRLKYMLLKPSMVTPGKTSMPAPPETVAEQTPAVFRRVVPAAVPCINFLSGGQTPQQASANLNALNQGQPQPWMLTFSYGRALQAPALEAWRGDARHADRTQAVLLERARLNAAACRGEYDPAMEPSEA